MSGKWDDPDVPKRGWSCTNIEDLEEPSATCEMCEVQTIRFVHTMTHPSYPVVLETGCICAGNMEGDPSSARLREAIAKNQAGRRSRWLERPWRMSRARNEFLNTGGFNVVVYDVNGDWGARVKHRRSGFSQYSIGYDSNKSAKLAAFKRLLWMEEEMPWIRP